MTLMRTSSPRPSFFDGLRLEVERMRKLDGERLRYVEWWEGEIVRRQADLGARIARSERQA